MKRTILFLLLSLSIFFNCDQNDTKENFTLTLNVEKTGTVNIQPGNITVTRGTYEFDFENGTIISLKAGSINTINKIFNFIYDIPDSAAPYFKAWTGDIDGSSDEQTFVMDSDKEINVEFNLSGITRSDIRYIEDDSLYLIQALTYDKDGFIKKVSLHDYDGSFVNSSSYYYDDEEKLIKI